MLTEVPQDSLLFRQIERYAATNSQLYPYVKDFFQETKPVMQAVKAFSMPGGGIFEKLKGLGAAVQAQSSELFESSRPEEHARFEILRIQSVDQPSLKSRYLLRKTALKFRIGQRPPDAVPAAAKHKALIGLQSVPIIDPSINECMLFLGHSNAMIQTMCNTGARPDLGHYDEGAKGHGALGRGAYLTDRIDKAITYSPCPSCGQTGACNDGCPGRNPDPGPNTRSILLNRVLLGYSMRTEIRGGDLRHANLNQMVRKTNYEGLRGDASKWAGTTGDFQAREDIINKLGNDPNLDRNEGRQAPLSGVTLKSGETPLTEVWDSMYGAANYAPGASAIVAIVNKNSFDSDEYLVRNADQILPAYVIHYRIVP